MGAAQQLTYDATFNAELERARLFNDKEVDFNKYSNFKDVEEFNRHWEMIMAEYKKYFKSKVQRDILTHYRQYGCVHPGVVNASYNTLIESFEVKFGYKPSRDTFRTTIDKADKLGILIKNFGQRLIFGRGSNSANIIVFNRYEDVKTYQIARMEREKEEIMQLLEENYAAAKKVTQYAHNARVWFEQKQENEFKKQEYEAEKARREKELADQAAAQAKRDNMYNKMRELLAAKKLDQSQLNEYAGIVFGTIKKAMKLDGRISKEQAESIAYKCFMMMCNTADKNVKKTRAALLSYLLKRDLLNVATGYKPSEIAQKQAVSSGKNVRVEKAPEWFANRHIRENEASDNTIDFVAERKKVMKKLGHSEY